MRNCRIQPLFVAVVTSVLAASIWAQAMERPPARVPLGFTDSVLVSNLTNVTKLSFAPDGRLFISEQQGAIRVVKDGALLEKPFLKLENVNAEGEHGLLGLAFDPEFATQPFVYIYYMVKAPVVHARVSRFRVDGDSAVPGSEEVLLELAPTGSSIFHCGGSLHFGPDGKLYLGVGDNANRKNAQRLNNAFGKMLRMNRDGTIPEDNPFFASTEGNNRAIYAFGFRNPWTFSFEPGTGRLFIGDVGAETWESIEEGLPGQNYGWPFFEGPSGDPTRFRNPVFTYRHGPNGDDNVGCAITGGVFYPAQASSFPSTYAGKYFFLDYCNAWVRVLDPRDSSVTGFASGMAPNPIDLQVGPDGSLYYASRWDGTVRVIRYAASSRDPASASPLPQRLSETGLYKDIRSKVIDPRNRAFEPQYPLWSDGAEKARWISLPPGGVIDTGDMDHWVVPVGTRFWKEFVFREDGVGKERRVETRMTEKVGAREWRFASYAWNEEQTDATLVPAEGLSGVFPIGGGKRHDIPGVASCVRCHGQRSGDPVLGFEALQLSVDREGGVPAGLTLRTLELERRLSRSPEVQPRIHSSTLSGRRAMGYLHANCGSCHNPGGSASFTSLFLRHENRARSESEEPAYKTSVNVPSGGFEIPGVEDTFRILPGDLASSSIMFRMGERGSGAAMPPLGTALADREGIGAITSWILELGN